MCTHRAGRRLPGRRADPTDAALPAHDVDAHADVKLAGTMSPYVWTINGDVFGKNTPIRVAGQQVQLDVTNSSMMSHPCTCTATFALPNGVRKDTVMVPPMTSTSLQLQASNPAHRPCACNICHAEAGAMIAELPLSGPAPDVHPRIVHTCISGAGATNDAGSPTHVDHDHSGTRFSKPL